MTKTLKEKCDELFFAGGTGEPSTETPLVIQVVNLILSQAVEERATDVHIEPTKESVRVRYRIDGILYDVLTLQKDAIPIVPRVKIMAELNPDVGRTHTPQDGRFDFKTGNREMDIRVSTFPTIMGEKVALRILDKGVTFKSLNQLGLSDAVRGRFESLIHRSNGLIFVTGPTNNGKTTTLYAALALLNAASTNIVTLEDPVEYQLKGINQGQINSKVGLTFSNGLRSLLRQDPDVIFVGEIRDYETAEITVRASLTGHLVFSTLHTNDAVGAVTRLLEMGIEPFLISSSLIGVLAQRLVRKICPSCKTSYVPPETVLKEMSPSESTEKRKKGAERDGDFYLIDSERSEIPSAKGKKSDIPFYRGKGCPSCYQIGYHGQIGVFELVEVNEEIRNLILAKSTGSALKAAAVRAGLRTLRDDGFDKVKEGLTTIEEVLRVTRES